MAQKTIAIDVDDVLSMSAAGFAAFTNEQWGGSMQADDYTEEWAKAWGVSVEEALKRSLLFHNSGVVGRYEPFADALPILKKLARRYTLVIMTSRQSVLKPETDVWLERHFPGLFSGIHYMGFWDDVDTATVHHRGKQTKAELCRQLGADYLIDDQAKHCVAAAEAGVRTLLFGNYGWNRDLAKLPAGVTRVHSWHEVAAYFDQEGDTGNEQG